MNTRKIGMRFVHGAIAATLTLMMPVAHADDLEVFTNPGLGSITPNLIFILDLSGSMNQTPNGTTPVMSEQSRLDILKDAISSILNSGLPEINVGYTYFRDYSGVGIRFPASKLTSDANTIDSDIPAGTQVKDVIEGMVAGASASQETPTVPALFEVARYLRGEVPYYGRRSFGSWNTGSNKYTGGDWRAANPASYTGSSTTVYTTLADPTGTNRYCNDYTATGGSNGCSSVIAAGAEMSCTTQTVAAYAGRVCDTIATTCDSGCRQDCPGGTVYTQPASGCLLDGNGDIWVTASSGGQPRRCCQASDAGGSECLSNLNYPSSCPTGLVCRMSDSRPPAPAYDYQRCNYKNKTIDDRIYTSPITAQCQKTAVVLLTDGDPSSNSLDYGRLYSNGTARSPRVIRELIADNDSDPTNNRNDIVCDDYSVSFGGAPGTIQYANCGKELVEFLHEEDQISSLEGTTVDTYTIGFGLTGPAASATWGYLTDLADAGGGQAFQASDVSTLTDAFDQIIANVTSGNQRFSGFATSFDTGTLQTGNKAYLTLFNPKDERAWEGNVKGYFVANGVIADVNGDEATEIDPFSNRLVFKPTARSFWSSSADGNSTLEGGAVDTLNPATRNIYVITNASETNNVSLNDGNHNLDTSNANLTAAVMGMPGSSTATNVTDMIDWARSARMGDPLHAEPRTIQYDPGTIGEVMYVTTNQGYLHAINVTNPTGFGDLTGGAEMFAFMPYQMIGTLQTQFSGNVAGSHIYGLDGPMTVWTQDSNGDGAISGGEKAYLFFGMRRGGNSYFAVDVSDPNNPKLAWQIDGGSAGFESLGESWSSMTVAKVSDGGADRHVLIFGGGYDSATQDVANQARGASGDNSGMGIYIVDALTGALLNSIGADDTGTGTAEFMVDVPAMKYSIPSAIRTEDTDGNGYQDRLYVGDVGGQVWRVDITEGDPIGASSTLSTYMFADIGVDSGGASDSSTNRRFYYPPSVAHTERDGDTVTSVAIGSGYRAHPLNSTVNENFVVLFDKFEAKGPPAAVPPPLTIANLYNATSNVIQTTTGAAQTAAISALNAKDGWVIDLSTAQKVLARARTFKNVVFFTAFESGTTDVCDFSGGTNRFYAVSLTDATGALEEDVDNDGVTDNYLRDIGIDDQAAILGPPELVTQVEDGTPSSPKPFCTTVFAGAQAVMQFCDAPVRVNWQSLQ